jgi:hypothetical protein
MCLRRLGTHWDIFCGADRVLGCTIAMYIFTDAEGSKTHDQAMGLVCMQIVLRQTLTLIYKANWYEASERILMYSHSF